MSPLEFFASSLALGLAVFGCGAAQPAPSPAPAPSSAPSVAVAPSAAPSPAPSPAPPGPTASRAVESGQRAASGDLPALAATLPEAKVRACRKDDECGLTAYVDGSCCGDRCRSRNAFRQDFVEKLRVQRESACKSAECPPVTCFGSTVEDTVMCVQGICTYVPVDHGPTHRVRPPRP